MYWRVTFERVAVCDVRSCHARPVRVDMMRRISRLVLRRSTCLGVLLVAFAACALPAPDPIAPVFPENPAIPAPYRGAAFILDVSTRARSVKVSAPTAGVAKPISNARFLFQADNRDAAFSLLGGDAVDLVVAGYVAGALGAEVPGKVLVTFDMQILNKLAGVQLVTPTFPTPPSGVSGLQAFPIEVTVTQSPGGVGAGGNVVIVTSPSFGSVVHSNHWDGAPHNFFNDVGCTSTATDCFRYESFGNIAPLGASAARQVGFLIDPTVSEFRVKVILAADLQAVTPPAPATVTGTITSNIGAIGSVQVSLSGGSFGVSGVSGVYSVSSVAPGVRAITLSNVPVGCAVPPLPPLTVIAGNTHTVNIALTCVIPTGAISGVITSSLGGGIAGVTVSAVPTGASPTPTTITLADGAFVLANVPASPSTGALAIANLPSNCTNPGPVSYTGLTVGGLVRDIVITCAAPPVTYPLTATWGPITAGGATGRQITLTFAIDMGSAPGSLAVDGANADSFAAIEFDVRYDGTGLNWISRALLSPAEFDLGTVGDVNPFSLNTILRGAIASSTGATRTGAFSLVRLSFGIAAGFQGTITPQVTVIGALGSSSGLVNIAASVVVVGPGSLVVP